MLTKYYHVPLISSASRAVSVDHLNTVIILFCKESFPSSVTSGTVVVVRLSLRIDRRVYDSVTLKGGVMMPSIFYILWFSHTEWKLFRKRFQ